MLHAPPVLFLAPQRCHFPFLPGRSFINQSMKKSLLFSNFVLYLSAFGTDISVYWTRFIINCECEYRKRARLYDGKIRKLDCQYHILVLVYVEYCQRGQPLREPLLTHSAPKMVFQSLHAAKTVFAACVR